MQPIWFRRSDLCRSFPTLTGLWFFSHSLIPSEVNALLATKFLNPVRALLRFIFKLLFLFPISLFYFSSNCSFCTLVHTDLRTDIIQIGTANLPMVPALQTYSSAGQCRVDLYTSHSCGNAFGKVSIWDHEISAPLHIQWREATLWEWVWNDSLQFSVL